MTYEYMTGMGAGSIADTSSTVLRPAALVARPVAPSATLTVAQPVGMSQAEIDQYRAELKSKSEGQLQTLILLHQRSQATNAGYATGAAPGAAERYRDVAIRAGQMARLEQQELQLRQLAVAAPMPTEQMSPMPTEQMAPPGSEQQQQALLECQSRGMLEVEGRPENLNVLTSCGCTPTAYVSPRGNSHYCCPPTIPAIQAQLGPLVSNMALAVVRGMEQPLMESVQQLCPQSRCIAEAVKASLYPRMDKQVIQAAVSLCDQLAPVEQAPTQQATTPWYKHPAVLVGGGILAAIALMKLMGQRSGMTRNPDYKVGDLVVNRVGAVGRVIGVTDDYVRVEVKSAWDWDTTRWPYDVLETEPRNIEWAIKMARQRGEIRQPNPTKMLAPTGKPYYMTKSPGQPGFYRVYGETDFGEELIGRVTGTPGGYYIHWVRGVHGPSAQYNKGPHPDANAAATEAYRIWNKQGRVWIGE
jgi:hypothetical protein